MGRNFSYRGDRESAETTGDLAAVRSPGRGLRFFSCSYSKFRAAEFSNGRPIVSYRRLFVLVLVLFAGAAVRRAQPVVPATNGSRSPRKNEDEQRAGSPRSAGESICTGR